MIYIYNMPSFLGKPLDMADQAGKKIAARSAPTIGYWDLVIGHSL